MNFAPLLLMAAVTTGLGCASTARGPVSTFPFERDGVEYAVLAFELDRGRANDLVRLDGDRLAFRARDRDQDGTLDTVLVGTLSLPDANAIYLHGIATAQGAGRYQMREPDRTFTLRVPDGRLVVWSVAEGGTGWSNRLAQYDGDGHVAWVYVDADADGRLDGLLPGAVAEGQDVPAYAQAAYARVLEAGRRADQVESVDDRVRVRPAQ